MLKLKQFEHDIKKHIDRWVRILFQKHTSSLTSQIKVAVLCFALNDNWHPSLVSRKVIAFPRGREQLSFQPRSSIGSYPLPASRRQHMLCSSVAVAEALRPTEHASQFLQFLIPLLVLLFSKMADQVAFLRKL